MANSIIGGGGGPFRVSSNKGMLAFRVVVGALILKTLIHDIMLSIMLG